MEANMAGAGPELRPTPVPCCREAIDWFIMNVREKRYGIPEILLKWSCTFLYCMYKLPGVVMYGPGISFSYNNQSMKWIRIPHVLMNGFLDFKSLIKYNRLTLATSDASWSIGIIRHAYL